MSIPPRTALHTQLEATQHEPEALLAAVACRFGSKVAIASSLGAQSLVIIDMLHQLGRTLPVLFLDTDLHHPETVALRLRIQSRYRLPITRVRPDLSLDEQADRYGPELWKRDPDVCCLLRKVQPLDEALSGLDAWVTGLRRGPSSPRADLQQVEWDADHNLVKINPLAHWTRDEVFAYLARNDVPYNPLLDQGYRTVGCAPCSQPACLSDAPDDERAGRWTGATKTECGIHVATEETEK
jgi:phosphoadenosine phosphosulfate reductase